MTGGVGGLQGSLAEYAAVDADLLAPKPANLSMREAAALPLIFITAWEGPGRSRRVSAPDRRCWSMAAPAASAMSRSRSRAHSARRCSRPVRPKSLRSDRAIRRDADRLRESRRSRTTSRAIRKGAGFDIVFDTVGGATLDASFDAGRRFGHVVSALGWGSHALAPLSFRAATYSGVFTLLPLLTGEGRAHHGEILREAARLVEAGKLSVRLEPRGSPRPASCRCGSTPGVSR